MTDRKQRAATIGDPTSSSFTTHPLEFTEIDLGPISESTVAPLTNEGALIEIEPVQQAADIPEDAPSVIWDLPPPDFNGPSPDAAPPAYDEALTCGTECPPLPRHPYQDDFAFDLEDSRRNAEMRLELALIKANRKKMYINFILGILFFLIILIICRFTFFDTSRVDNHPPLSTTISTIFDITSTDDPEQE